MNYGDLVPNTKNQSEFRRSPCAIQLGTPWFAQSRKVHGFTFVALGEYTRFDGSPDALRTEPLATINEALG